MTPKVSIIVPVYNVSKYLSRCLDSVLNQTFKDFECICVNDGSTDNSLDILREYANKDKRIIILSQKNSGASAARNLGIKNVKGEYITFVDSDDFIKDDYIRQFINKFSSGDYDMVVGGYIKYTEKSEKNVFIKDDGISMFFNTPICGRMYKYVLIKENNLFLPLGLVNEDTYFSTRVYNLTDKIGIIEYAGYYYFIENPTSLTHTTMKRFDPRFVDWMNVMNVIQPMDEFHRECKDYSIIRMVILYLLYSGKSASYKEFISEYKRLFGWLKQKIPNYKKNKYISLFTKSEDILLYKVGIWGFILLDRLGLISLLPGVLQFFAKLYGIIK